MSTEPKDADQDAGQGVAGIDRRGLLGGIGSAGVLASLAGTLPAGALAASDNARREDPDDDRLPDGSAFTCWEQPLTYSKTYYVDNAAAAADDNGPGDRARPFRTIGKAAAILQPGERVVIASGIYRECVRPVRGGTGPGQMISYEAAPGAKVYIRGSEVLKDGWRQQPPIAGPRSQGAVATGATVWRYDLTSAIFPDAYNPFALPSIMGSWGWLDGAIVDMGPYLRRRGLVFIDGKPFEPMEQLRELTIGELPGRPDFTKPPAPQNGMPPRRRGSAIMQEIGGSPSLRSWTDHSGTAIYVALPSGSPSDHLIEATTRQHAFIPAKSGLGYIRLKGLTFQHAGNAYPFPQYGMVSLAGGDHWILEDNVLEWANGMGLDIGSDANSSGAPHIGAAIVVRRNTLRYCGVEGIGGMGTSDTLIEDNLIEWCGWADAERGWEAAGAKFHRARNMMFRRNVVRHMRYANAVWWDVDNVNCRITSNIFADVHTVGAAIHIEMTPAQNSIDNNIIWDVRNAEPGTPGQRGCAGSGIFDNASSNLTIANNLIGRCDNAGIFAIVRPDRGRPVADSNNVVNNIFYKCAKAGIVFLNKNNKAECNLYVAMPKAFQGLFEGEPTTNYDPLAWTHIRYYDLTAWQQIVGWDQRSLLADFQIAFDPGSLQLRYAADKPLPRTTSIVGITRDVVGHRTGATRIPGPIATIALGKATSVDPRRP